MRWIASALLQAGSAGLAAASISSVRAPAVEDDRLESARARILALDRRVAALAPRLEGDADAARALELLALPADLLARVEQGERTWREARLPLELSRAERLVGSLERGEPPPRAPGRLRRVHRLPSSGELLPYALYAPARLPANEPAPLLVALHGLGGDEQSFFAYGFGLLEREAEERGLLVASPCGWRPDSLYLGRGEEDVLAVIEAVQRGFRVDPERVWLIGHSMGAFGALRIAARHPRRFAAVVPIGGGGRAAWLDSLSAVPVLLVHGDDDRLVPASLSRRLFEQARARRLPWEYLEVAEANHVTVVARALPQALDFLERLSRRRR